MFQPPVNNLEKIRKARKRVKQLLLQIGLESCREVLEEINSNNPGDYHFSSTSWADVSLWEANGRRNDYRSKPFCCSLCKFSTKLLSSFKSHLKRYHEDERDQELMSACPNCPFTSRSKTVAKHIRMFHMTARKVPIPALKEFPNVQKNNLNFSCSKCPFTENLYYSMKKHVLLTHYKTVADSYFGEKSEEEIFNIPGMKIQPVNRFFCRKCHYSVSSHDALMYHVLTSEKHRDLELKLRTDISETSRAYLKKGKTKSRLPVVSDASAPKQTEITSSSSASVPVSVPQRPKKLLEIAPAVKNNGVPNITNVTDSSGSLVPKPPTSIAPTVQVGFVNNTQTTYNTNTLSQNPSITLQTALPQSLFLSSRFPLNQPVTATVLPSTGQIIPTAQTAVRPAVLPLNQPLPRGLLHVNQPTVLTCSQPGIFPVNQSVRPGNITTNQTGVPQNTFLTAPIFRQLIPTGKQVNGMPTYTFAPISVLPVAPSALPTVNPPKVPVKVKLPEQVIQISRSPVGATAIPPVLQLNTTSLQKAATPVPLGKEAKQWKTCPVCNELFPSNVYQVHMEVAHVTPDTKLKPTDTTTSIETKQPVVIAAQASFLKLLKDKSIKCASCRTVAQEEELLKHLLMHGMICLYCKAVFHETRNFVYHMKILHQDKKTIHVDFSKKGLQIPTDADGTVLFPHFDFTLKLSRDVLGDKEINLAVVIGSNAQAATLYLKLQHKSTDTTAATEEQVSKCPFCNYVLSKTEAYETHLKDRHHIMPTVHTILKTPAFKCIHCCGVYTGSMTLSAISVHLLRCRNAPKDISPGAEVTPENNAGKTQSLRGGMHDYAKPQSLTSDTQHSGIETNQQDRVTTDKELPTHKRRKVDFNQDHAWSHVDDASLELLAMVPDRKITSNEYKKEFLLQYFHKRPYPSKKEITILSNLLEMWKSEVSSFIGTKRYMCMKFLKTHKQRVLLGYQMSELKKVKHDLDINDDY
ncbi:activity-dependent neuroprotector homeobox protein 2 [Pelobates fuscus]|uniref:activity-dependent neuroprotector homeobox protein 2 n=1 Tax=Pelobates fuscus TaxID=191477 RepID=UPI002FE4A4BB